MRGYWERVRFRLGFTHFPFSGTGSYPNFANGWHLNNRQTVKSVPLKKPCTASACMAYSLQVGTKRQ